MSWAMTENGYSQRRACGLVGIAPKTFRYVSTRPDDGELRDRLKTLADERRRFGYRRLHILLRREGVGVNHKKLFRLYREERLTVRRRGGRRRALGTRAPMAIPQGPNQRWSTDFVQDVLTDGRRFRIWALVDDFSRECLALVADTSISGRRVARELDRVVELRGRPCNDTNAMISNAHHLRRGLLSVMWPSLLEKQSLISRSLQPRALKSSFWFAVRLKRGTRSAILSILRGVCARYMNG